LILLAKAANTPSLGLAAAAPTPVGCDIEPVVERPEPTWRGLLGLDGYALAELITRAVNEDFSYAATRVWTAHEASKKAGMAPAQVPLTFDRCDGTWCVLRSGAFAIVSWIGSFTDAACAISVGASLPSNGAVEDSVRSGLVAKPSPKGLSPAYSYRHLVGFRDTNLVGNVYFSNHIEWQGRCREMFIRDKAPSVLERLGKDLSLVTTHCSCEYLVELSAFDEVRLDMRLDEAAGNRIAFRFDYWRCNRGTEELVAIGKQEVSCLRTEGGRKVPTDIPESLLAALQPYLPNFVPLSS
jgi:acyl-CoA thioesterase FadM